MSCLKKVKKLAKDLCATFEGCDGCMLTPNDRDQCVYYWQSDRIYYRCRYFETHVLPSNPALEEAYYEEINVKQEDKKDVDYCEMCGKSYKKNSNRQKYCGTCKERAEKEARRKRDAKYRETKRRYEIKAN